MLYLLIFLYSYIGIYVIQSANATYFELSNSKRWQDSESALTKYGMRFLFLVLFLLWPFVYAIGVLYAVSQYATAMLDFYKY